MHVEMSHTLNVSVYTRLIILYSCLKTIDPNPTCGHESTTLMYIQTYTVSYAEIILVGEHALFF